MSEALGTMGNQATMDLVNLYRSWGAGGSGILVTGNVMIDRKALGEPGNVVLEDDRDMAVLTQWATGAKANGAQIWMQINHPGRQTPKGLNVETVAPSAIPFSDDMKAMFGQPRALTDAEVVGLIERYGRAAGLAEQAGFDGVQIHGAHGYLVSQFLSPLTNTRDDAWGGTPEKRRAFVLAILKAMRDATSDDFSIGIKLNSADFQRGGFSEQESIDLMVALSEAGIDLIEVSGGTYEAPAMTGVKASTRAREAYFMDFAERVRSHIPNTPLVVTGGFRTYAGMKDALDTGSLDFVGIARLLAVEPSVSKRLLAGQDPVQTIRPIKTGIGPVDRMAIMEVSWYTRQLKRIAQGKQPKPNESPLKVFFLVLVGMIVGTQKTKRLRAS